MHSKTFIAIAAVTLFALTPALAIAANHKATAHLHGSPITTGKARYQEKLINGRRDQRLKVNVAHAMPLQALQVRVNGHPVGVAVANIAGNARLNLRTGGIGSADPIPAGFPTLRDGDVVTVGSLSGVCFDDSSNGRYELEGKVEIGSAEYKAEYKERQQGDTLRRGFEVEIEGGPANTSFEIVVNGAVVATISTNSLGNAQVEFSAGGDDGDDSDDCGNHEPLPEGFPSLQVGDTVSIGDVVVTLASSDSGNGSGDNGDDDGDDVDDDGGGDD